MDCVLPGCFLSNLWVFIEWSLPMFPECSLSYLCKGSHKKHRPKRYQLSLLFTSHTFIGWKLLSLDEIYCANNQTTSMPATKAVQIIGLHWTKIRTAMPIIQTTTEVVLILCLLWPKISTDVPITQKTSVPPTEGEAVLILCLRWPRIGSAAVHISKISRAVPLVQTINWKSEFCVWTANNASRFLHLCGLWSSQRSLGT